MQRNRWFLFSVFSFSLSRFLFLYLCLLPLTLSASNYEALNSLYKIQLNIHSNGALNVPKKNSIKIRQVGKSESYVETCL